MEELLVTETIITSVWEDAEGYSDAYGYKVYANHPLAKIVDGKLFLDKNEVVDYDETKFNSKIPTLYCIREVETSRFVCGLDLIPNGNVWVGIGKRDVEFKTIEQALSIVEEESKCNCYIRLESEMRI